MVYANKISSDSRPVIVYIVEEYWMMYSLFVELILCCLIQYQVFSVLEDGCKESD